MSVKGFKSQQALKQKLSGYTEDQSIDQQRYVTVQEMSGRRHALDTMIHAIYEITAAPLTAAAGSNIRVIKCVGHGANKNDVIKLSDGTQFSAISVPDADTIITSVELDVSPVGDTFTIWRHITPAYNSDGSLNVSVTPSPLSIRIDGVTTVVNVDTVVPADTVRVPVELYGASGQINITAGDINVQLSDTGVNPDITRIGNGTNRLDINASNEALVHDTDALAQLVTANVNLDAIEVLNTAGNASTSSIDTKLTSQATAAKQDLLLAELQLKADLTETQPVSIAGTIAVSGPLTDAELRLTPVLVTASAGTNLNTSALNLEATQSLIKAKTDNLDVLLSTRAAESTLSAMSAKLPATLGQKAMAASMAVVISSDQTAIPITGSITTGKNYVAGTLKSAQIMVGLTEVRATTDGAAPSATREKLMIKSGKNNTGSIFIIPTGGNISTGMEIIGPDRLEFLYDPTDYYLISDTAAQTVEILEVE